MRKRLSGLGYRGLISTVVLTCSTAANAASACPDCLIQPDSTPACFSVDAPTCQPRPVSGIAPATVSTIAPEFSNPTVSSKADHLLVAQRPDPNRDRFPQPLPTPEPITPTEQAPVLPTPAPITPAPTTPTPTTPTPTPETTISVKRVEVTGSTILRQQDLQPITSKVEGRAVTLEELRGVADQITQLYLNQGFITSRAILVDQTIADGVVTIRVVEGGLEQIDIQGNRRVRSSYIRRRIQLGAKAPLRQDRLEDQLRLLKADPLFENIEASLRPGTQLGQSILTVRVTEANPFQSAFNIDNYSPPSVGSERFGIFLGHRNLTGHGDELTGSYNRTVTGGSNVFDFNYRMPINPMNGTIQLRVAPDTNKITDPEFEELDIRGSRELYEISYRQPLIRTPREEFALSAGFSIQNGQTFIFNDTPFPFSIGTEPEGISRTRVLKFGQDYVKRDPQGAWALRSQFSLGLDIFDATINEAPVPDGRFFSWLAQVQRVQRLGNNQLLIVQADLQLSPNSLLPSQQFVIGGGQSLRGYRQNARSGDNGFRFSVEDRIAILRDESGLPTLQLAPFIDVGAIWNVSDNPTRLPNQTFLLGAGLGLLWQPIPRLGVRVDYGHPLIEISDRGNNAQDKGFYFSVVYQP